MASVSALTGDYSSSYTRTSVSASSNELTMTDFYTLLAAQLKYQDADNPMDTSEMMAQMVQTQMIQAITNMNSNNTSSYLASLVGKQVTVQEMDSTGRLTTETTTGEVSGVVLGSDPKIIINGKSYTSSQITEIGNTATDTDTDGGSDTSADTSASA